MKSKKTSFKEGKDIESTPELPNLALVYAIAQYLFPFTSFFKNEKSNLRLFFYQYHLPFFNMQINCIL